MCFKIFFVMVGFAMVCIAEGATIKEIKNPSTISEKISEVFTGESEEDLANFDKTVAQEFYNVLNETSKNPNTPEISKLSKQDFNPTNIPKVTDSVISKISKNASVDDTRTFEKSLKPKNKIHQDIFMETHPGVPDSDTNLTEFNKQFDFEKEKPDFQEVMERFDDDFTQSKKNLEDKAVRVIDDANVFVNLEDGLNENDDILDDEDLYIIKQKPDRLLPVFNFKENGIFGDLLDNNLNAFRSNIRSKYNGFYDEDKDFNNKDLGLMDDTFLDSIISEDDNDDVSTITNKYANHFNVTHFNEDFKADENVENLKDATRADFKEDRVLKDFLKVFSLESQNGKQDK